MDTNNRVIQLCMAGAAAEFAQRVADARALYQQAWEAATDDYEACIAAHYMARHQEDPQEIFRWNAIALAHADAVGDARVQPFYGSLYVNMGHAHELMGDQETAEHYFALAATFGVVHETDEGMRR